MIKVDCEQRSELWHAVRLGIPTASEFHRILTPTGKISEQAAAYRHELIAEWLTGRPAETYVNSWMQWGNLLEGEARAYYEFQREAPVEEVGFIYLDDRKLVGCSPDGLTPDGGGVELKCPSPGVHVHYLLNGIPIKYKPQVQGAMWITGAEWWDWVSYHPDMPAVIVRSRRDETYIANLSIAVESFILTMLCERDQLMRQGVMPLAVPLIPEEAA